MDETIKKGKKKKGVKIVLIVIGVIVVLGIISAIGGGDTGKETDAAGTAETKAGT